MDTSSLIDLKSLTLSELQALCSDWKLPRFRADQLAKWLYQKGVASFEEMTNLPLSLRSELAGKAHITRIMPIREQRSKDGTIKFLFKLHDKEHQKIEAVLIPDFYPDGVANRLTVCVSSQVGCVFGCSFCATGKMGFFRNLTHGEIVDQVQHINVVSESVYGKRITNIVYMGMGEPLHNYSAVRESAAIICSKYSVGLSPKRITVSTVGLTKQIKQFADHGDGYNLAISLHAADDAKRNKIMPINESMGLEDLKNSVKYYHHKTKQPLTYEYLLFQGFNDDKDDARNLAQISQWAPSKINIIMYNNVLGVEFQRASEEQLNRFMKHLVQAGVRATVRRSRGDDIDAGCGQLAIREDSKRGKTIAKT